MCIFLSLEGEGGGGGTCKCFPFKFFFEVGKTCDFYKGYWIFFYD